MEEKFELQPELTGVALAYTNKKYIADEIFPTVAVDQKSFQYRKYDKASFLTVPETRIGEKGIPNELELKSRLLTETCEDHAIREKIPQSRIEEGQKASRPVNIQAITATQIAEILKASREVSFASKLMNTSNYGNNYKTLTSAQKINQANVNAVDTIWEGIDKVMYKPNTMVLSRASMSALRRNPYVVSACKGSDLKAGVASYDGLKDLFEVDRILVGESIVNNAKKGQTPTFAACWTNDIALLHIDPVATTDFGITFGYKAQYDALQIGSYFDPEAGTKGCQVLKGYETYLDVFTCPECGYLLKGVI